LPELPEVETIVRDLNPHLSGQVIAEVRHLNPAVLRHPSADLFVPAITGQRASSIRRRGKFIQIALGSGELLVVHLGMTGTLTMEPSGATLRPHTHLRLGLDSGIELRYRDPRRFGRVLLGELSTLEALGVMPRLGAEPLSPGFVDGTPDQVLKLAHRPVKAVLLDQAVIAGCGNIYADEACFLARVRPSRQAWTLTASARRRLLQALPIVMREAIRLRGTSFSDYRDGFGAKGEAFEALLVYGRAGQPCIRCGSALRQATVAARTTVFCVRCQL
jgi:formamidopyrimidine-DNA glycosylase